MLEKKNSQQKNELLVNISLFIWLYKINYPRLIREFVNDFFVPFKNSIHNSIDFDPSFALNHIVVLIQVNDSIHNFFIKIIAIAQHLSYL